MTRAFFRFGTAQILLISSVAAQAMNPAMPGMAMPAPTTPATSKASPGSAEPTRPVRKKPGAAQAGGHHHAPPSMPGMDMAEQGSKDEGAVADPHAGHDMSNMDMSAHSDAPVEHEMPEMDGMDHQGMDHEGMDMAPASGTALPAGNAPAPAPPADHYADRVFGTPAMIDSRAALRHHHGGMSFSKVMLNLAEYQFRRGHDGYRWEGEAWFGDDIDRLTLKSEGEGVVREGVESAELQLLYSRAVGPYFNLQAGIRQDFQPKPSRTYATIGFEGLAPYWFEVEGALFLSNKGGVLGRLGAHYDQRLTQRLILQPRIELNLAAQDVRENGIGSGLSSAELGLRLRYDIAREFGPYVGVSWEGKLGKTGDFSRLAGEDPTTTSLVAGVRFWF